MLWKTFSFTMVLLGRWELEVLRTNPTCKKAHFYSSKENVIKDTPGFSKEQISYFTTFCLNSEIQTVDMHTYIKKMRNFFCGD